MQQRNGTKIEDLLVLFLERKHNWSSRQRLLQVLDRSTAIGTVDVVVGRTDGVPDGVSRHARGLVVDRGGLTGPGNGARPGAPGEVDGMVREIRAGNYGGALILTDRHRSPWSAAYVCCLADIPERIGMSEEFGGGVLSTCIDPPEVRCTGHERYRYLLAAAGLVESCGRSPAAGGEDPGNE